MNEITIKIPIQKITPPIASIPASYVVNFLLQEERKIISMVLKMINKFLCIFIMLDFFILYNFFCVLSNGHIFKLSKINDIINLWDYLIKRKTI